MLGAPPGGGWWQNFGLQSVHPAGSEKEKGNLPGAVVSPACVVLPLLVDFFLVTIPELKRGKCSLDKSSILASVFC